MKRFVLGLFVVGFLLAAVPASAGCPGVCVQSVVAAPLVQQVVQPVYAPVVEQVVAPVAAVYAAPVVQSIVAQPIVQQVVAQPVKQRVRFVQQRPQRIKLKTVIR